MAAFDAPNREVCTLRRDRSNTPLQALVTLNDPVYVEMAQALGKRILNSGLDPMIRLVNGFRFSLVRPPTSEEKTHLLDLYLDAYRAYILEPEEAKSLVTNEKQPLPEGTDVVELAAWTVVANTLLNLDEVFMKR